MQLAKSLGPARRLLIGMAALLACCPNPAAADPATVLAYVVEGNGPNSTPNFAEATIELGGLGRDALVFVNASGAAGYKGQVTGAGIRVSIRYGKSDIVTEDDAFEGESLDMTYRASTSHICLLPHDQKATFIAWTERLGGVGPGGGNSGTTVRLEAVAVAADLPAAPRKFCGAAF